MKLEIIKTNNLNRVIIHQDNKYTSLNNVSDEKVKELEFAIKTILNQN